MISGTNVPKKFRPHLHSKLYMDIFNSLPVPALQLDSESRILLCNHGANDLFGWENGPVDQPLFTRFIGEEETDRFLDFYAATDSSPSLFSTTLHLPEDKTERVTIKAARADGDKRIVLLNRQDPWTSGCGASCQHAAILEAQYQHNPGGILMVNEKMEVLSYNEEFIKIWGISKAVQASRDDKASLRSVLDKLADPEAFISKVESLYNNRTEVGTDEVLLGDGRTLYRHTYPVHRQQKYLGRIWYFLDITPLKQAQLQLEKQKTLQKTILENVQDGIIACDSEGKIDLMNRAARILYNFTQRDPLGCDIDELIQFATDHMTPLTGEENPLQKALAGKIVENKEIVVTTQNGRQQTLRVNGQAISHDTGENTGAVISLHNISDIIEVEEQLKFMAYHDSLTGLPNRRLFHDLLLQCLNQAARHEQKIGILFLDLDNFKAINDQYGHDVGDALLTSVGKTLQSCLRKSDLLCRWGGDEFVIGLLENHGADDILKVAEKICATVLDCIHATETSLAVSATIGIAISPDHGRDPDLLIRNADVAMYHAKRLGKNRCELFTREPIPIPSSA